MVLAPYPIVTAALVAEPLVSSDVVQVSAEKCSYADGEIGYRVQLSIRDGWHLPARVSDHKTAYDPAPKAGTVSIVEVCADGMQVPISIWYVTKGVIKGRANGGYYAYEKSASVIFWVGSDPEPIDVSVRVRLTASNGTRTLPESVVSVTAK